MPLNLEYVLVTYGLWILVFMVYIPWIKKRRKLYRRSVQTFEDNQQSS